MSFDDLQRHRREFARAVNNRHFEETDTGILFPRQGVNIGGTFLCCQRALPAMRNGRWGRIVNFSSTAGKNISTVGGAHYTAAKAGILGFTRHLAKEVAADGIACSAPSGTRAMRSRASLRSWAPQRSLKRATTSGW